MTNPEYLTEERHSEIQLELGELKTTGRKDVAARLKHAKELGDLSENSEYQSAREDQTRLEQRIFELEEILRRATIIKKTAGASTVRVGTKVKLRRGSEIFAYTIVGSNEARPAQGLISNESPLGRALLGKKANENVILKTPRGEVSYHIVAID